MTENELLAQTNDWMNAGVDSVTLFLSVLFAYFVVGHIVGKALSRVQLGIIASIYSVVMVVGIVTIHSQFTTISRFYDALSEMGSTYVSELPEGYAPVVVTIYTVAFLASHYYMFSSRRKKQNE